VHQRYSPLKPQVVSCCCDLCPSNAGLLPSMLLFVQAVGWLLVGGCTHIVWCFMF
jgi:hypothetical protein